MAKPDPASPLHPSETRDQLRQFLPTDLQVSDRDLSLFQVSLTLQRLGKGDRLRLAAAPDPIKGLVTKGCLRVYFIESDGTERVLYFAPEGWCLTAIGGAATERHGVLGIDALEPTELWLIDRARAGEERSDPACDRIWRALAESALLTFQQRLVGGLRKTAAQRYLDFRGLYPGLDSRIPQYHVAGYLGISPEFLSKLRKRLIRDEYRLVSP
jgi:CRP-like cAMP-binding protein